MQMSLDLAQKSVQTLLISNIYI